MVYLMVSFIPMECWPDPSVGFRIASERLLGQDGLSFMGGEFNKGCKLQCVRTKMEVPMDTEDNILVLGTKGKASEIIDSPEFRAVVDEVRKGERSPLVNLTPFLPGGKDEDGGENGKVGYDDVGEIFPIQVPYAYRYDYDLQ